MASACPDPEQLERLLNEELDRLEHDTLDTHVSSCAACRARVDELSEQQALLANLVDAFPAGAPAAPMKSPIPESIGEYEVLSEIGRGGMGAILEVRDPKLRRTMALKLIHGDAGGLGLGDVSEIDVGAQGRFNEEAQITSQLSHPGIVPVFELGRGEDGRPFFTMQLVSGRNLRAIFELVEKQEEDWTVPRALGVLLRVCEAMAYAHSQGVIHRDLKPANIMVGAFGEVYVMDWGVARVLDRPDAHDLRLRQELRVSSERQDTRAVSPNSPLVTADGDVVGTPVYMSPEQASGHIEELSTRSDVYSVGAMLYHLLTGQVPYVPPGERPSSHVILFRVAEGPPASVGDLAPSVPSELVAVCEKAMSREPDDRYQDMLEMAADLRAFLEQRVVKAYEAGGWARFKKWTLRNRNLALAIALGILAVMAGLGATAWMQSDANYRLQIKSDIYQLTHLNLQVSSLWPAHPEKIAELESFLNDGEALVARRAMHEEHAQGLSSDNADSEYEDKFLKDLSLFAAADGVLEDVRLRLAFAQSVEDRTVTSLEARGGWARAIASIADVDECPMYGGFQITPQLGLIPLGRDPGSGLWEFAHLQTGAVPTRNSRTGQLNFTAESGLVFVLIPGGEFRMGSTRDSEDPGYVTFTLGDNDYHGDSDEFGAGEVSLGPYLLSKYEMTQGQWLRASGSNPSVYCAESDVEIPGESWALNNPVDSISWSAASETLGRLALELPTEAQWERAARANAKTPWPWGATPECVVGRANFADPGTRPSRNWPAVDRWVTDAPGLNEYSDGYVYHAPVDAFDANAFGLFNMLGNVWEWCRDRYVRYDSDHAMDPTTGERTPAVFGKDELRVYRGGSFKHAFYRLRCADRAYDPPDYKDNYTGVRPARRITE